MLISLHIENIAVIKCLDLDLEKGFTVLTGETGAGKSIIIDAIGLLMGGKVQKDLIRSGEDSALVSGLFLIDRERTREALAELDIAPDEEGMLLIARTVTADGRSRIRIGGRSVPLSLLRQVTALLLDIHGQHDNQTLLDPETHPAILDEYSENAPLLASYKQAYDALCAVRREKNELAGDEREKAREVELLKYQIGDIDSVKPKAGEEEELESRRRRIRDGEKLRKNASLVSRALYRNEKGMSASELLAKAASSMKSLAPYLPQAEAYAERLTEYRYEIAEMGLEAAALAEDREDEGELDRIEGRLHELSKLKRKYGADLDEVIAYRERAVKRLEGIESAEERMEELEREERRLIEQAGDRADRLNRARVEGARRLESAVLEELRFLEMPKVRFHIAVTAQIENGIPRFRPVGADLIEFLISANPGEPLKPMDRIASGGELSRIMLAIKSAGAGKEGSETMIFDEIDTGISGKTSQKIGIRLRRLGEGAQVLCITHSAQIAAVAHSQLLISKNEQQGRVQTGVQVLDRRGRIGEIARIMGGAQMTETLLASAEELLCEYNPD